jgi:ATP-dependent Lon protease
MMPGKGRMTVTGNVRDVMKESISAAASYVRMRALAFGIKPPLFDERDIHVHVPEGATPKDGPSAGVAMATAIVSVMTGIPVRRDLAMTGEITLRGRVWPIVGLKEKLLAALRGGIKTVLIPEENAKDLVEIADSIKGGLEIVPVSRMDEVLARAMTRKPDPIEWDETTDHSSGRARRGPGRGGTLDAHRALNDRDTGAEAAVTSQNYAGGLGEAARQECPEGQGRALDKEERRESLWLQ